MYGCSCNVRRNVPPYMKYHYENRDEIDRFHARNHRLPLDYCITIDFVYNYEIRE